MSGRQYVTQFVEGALSVEGTAQVHIQAGGGIVADSEPESEYEETVNKSNAMSRAIDVAESAFTSSM